MCSTSVFRASAESNGVRSHVGLGAYIVVFLLGYVFAVAKKHLQVSSPSIKCGYPTISNKTSVGLGVPSEVLMEDVVDGGSGFVCILT
jgi:hypothetical protein